MPGRKKTPVKKTPVKTKPARGELNQHRRRELARHCRASPLLRAANYVFGLRPQLYGLARAPVTVTRNDLRRVCHSPHQQGPVGLPVGSCYVRRSPLGGARAATCRKRQNGNGSPSALRL